ncbi:cyclase family protein [Seongchinamella unica]|uniref:Cyclase family protein n=1 Tax=Seongchinamella unica TaxID=2547392 RepID=A0A4V2ZXB1_9GAMM|nr:cyclase family protein [Seongchinamella unica]TDG13934.1 cyclase family protein [Seongchinamella unica]
MKLTTTMLLAASLAFSASALSSSDDVWWPSEWGPDDERGAANRLTPEKVIAATSLIQRGQIYQLGRVYEAGMPLFPGRHYSLTIPGSPTGGPFGNNQTVYNDEVVSAQIGQVGTQFDGLGHIGTRVDKEDIFYNGFKQSEFATAAGLQKLGIENVGVFLTRGVLIDVAAYKGMTRLPVGTAISAEDLQGALRQQGVTIGEGDVVLIHTGHGQLWMVDNEEYSRGGPGIGLEAARWLAEQKIVMTAADTWAVEVIPTENENLAFPVHQELLGKRGIYNLENLDLSSLAADKVYEFAFMFAPVKFKGATGSPGNPIAVR